MSHLDYTKIFEEVRDHLVRCLPSDADVVFDADRRRLALCSRANPKLKYAFLVGDPLVHRVVLHTRNPRTRERRFTVLRPIEKLAVALHEAGVAGRIYEEKRRAEVDEDRRTVSLAQRLLTEAGIPNASNYDRADGDGVPRVFVEPAARGQVRLSRTQHYSMVCWPENAVVAVHPLLALLDAIDEFNKSRRYFEDEPQPEQEP